MNSDEWVEYKDRIHTMSDAELEEALDSDIEDEDILFAIERELDRRDYDREDPAAVADRQYAQDQYSSLDIPSYGS